MALGISGSNGGVSPNRQLYRLGSTYAPRFYHNTMPPLEVSYFINNSCNLACKHCYVGYDEHRNAVDEDMWCMVFEDLIGLGARTFGAVGKEPLLDWGKTYSVFNYLQKQRESVKGLRFGLVTNLTEMTPEILQDLEDLAPDYIDVSIDGNRMLHDFIRGGGTYDKTVSNLERFSEKLRQKIFISFTINACNQSHLSDVLDMMDHLGLHHLLVSPYVGNNEELYISTKELIGSVSELVHAVSSPLVYYTGMNVYVKSDVTTSAAFANELVHEKIIDKNLLYIDAYGVLFTEYKLPGDNVVLFNYQPTDPSFVNAIRITHDGYVVRCLDMFYPDVSKRAIGNVRQRRIRDILYSVQMQDVA
ncbi:MAG: radical SAM protein [Magnetococcales bacterium]|nr:radical SAM protein [Magnetococcales bacterium]